MKTEKNQYAFPGDGETCEGSITKREYFAAKIMAGLLVPNLSPTEIHMNGSELRKGIARSAVELADALIDALNTPVDKSAYSKLIDACVEAMKNAGEIVKYFTSIEHEYAANLRNHPDYIIDFDDFKKIYVPLQMNFVDTRGPQEIFSTAMFRNDSENCELGELYIPPHLTGRPRKLYVRVLLVAESTLMDDKEEQERRDCFVRCSGLVHCNQCGLPLYDHPHDPVQPDLTIACSRERVKL